MFNSEKQFTTRASKISFEETFMNVDTPDVSFDPSIGYRFGYPQNWLANPSEKKMIGLRSLRVTPSSHRIELYLNIHDTPIPAEDNPIAVYDVIWSITANNNLEEMLHNLINIVQPYNGRDFKFSYSFDPTYGNLSMYVEETVIENEVPVIYKRRFYFYDPDNTNKTNIKSFLRFLNQQETTANINKLNQLDQLVGDDAIPKSFTGVWNRTDLFFHSSFSTTRRGLIGRNNDFWQTPSKKYFFRDATNDFYVSFSTDGVHKIFPYHCNFYLELTFILNYDKSLN